VLTSDNKIYGAGEGGNVWLFDTTGGAIYSCCPSAALRDNGGFMQDTAAQGHIGHRIAMRAWRVLRVITNRNCLSATITIFAVPVPTRCKELAHAPTVQRRHRME
jgi:hypothetical protein